MSADLGPVTDLLERVWGDDPDELTQRIAGCKALIQAEEDSAAMAVLVELALTARIQGEDALERLAAAFVRAAQEVHR